MLKLGSTSGTDTIYVLSDKAEEGMGTVGVFEKSDRPSGFRFKATQYGEKSGLFPMSLEGMDFKTIGEAIDALVFFG